MDRDIPNFNPIVVGRMQQKQLQLHHQRLQNIKSFNQSRVATSAHHNRHNKKAMQQQEDKKTEIERNNLILFNKMLKIMKRNDPCNRAVSTANRVIARTSVELNRIQQQNRTMYERIEKQKPTIDNRKLYEQRKKQENILKFLGKYSAHSLQNTQAQSLRYEHPKENAFNGQRRTNKQDHYLQKLENQQLNFQKETRYEQIELEEQIDQEQFKAHTRGYQNRSKKSYSTNHTTNQIVHKPETPKNLASVEQFGRKIPTSAKDIILFKSKKDILMQKYEIKIVRSHLAYEIRATAIGEELEDPIKLVLSENVGNQLLEDNDYDYRRIIEKVGLRDNQLVVLQESTDNEEEQQDYHPAQLLRRQNKKEVYMNPSHISEQQNEEDSYRPPDSIAYSPARNTHRIDSLGPEHNDNVQIEQGECNETEWVEQTENGQVKPVYYTREAQEQQLQCYYVERKQGERAKKVRQLQQRGRMLQNNYEQALDEQIS